MMILMVGFRTIVYNDGVDFSDEVEPSANHDSVDPGMAQVDSPDKNHSSQGCKIFTRDLCIF